MKRKLILFIAITIISCNQTPKKSSVEENANTASTSDQQTIQTLREAYEFGFPLVVMHVTGQVMTNTDKIVQKGKLLAPINQLASAVEFPDDKFRDVVRPNNDTYYSTGSLDLSAEPMVLHLPNTNGRYYLFPMLDAWTNVFFSPGKRTTGTKEQTYLITGPKWNGAIPEGMTQVKSPTNMVWMIGRIQVNSAVDGATTVKKIQDGIKLYPLSVHGKSYLAPAGKINPDLPKKAPNDIVFDMSAEDYFNLLNKLMVDNPPTADDAGMMSKLSPLGIAPGATFDATKFPSAIQDSLKTLPQWAKQDIYKQGFTPSGSDSKWSIHQGLGDYKTKYGFRSGIAFGGLGANLDADAIYPVSLVDADGEPYDGSKHKYALHFDKGKTPPANAFWSLTMYDNEGFLCTNPINRFAIGDRNPLKKNADGSVDIYIQKDDPGKDKENNWLPAPNGPFNLLLRVYWPKEEMLNRSWKVPPVNKVQ